MSEEEASISSGEEGNDDEPVAKKARRGVQPSEVWAHVEKFQRDNGNWAWRCNYCQEEKSGAPDRVVKHFAKTCKKVSGVQEPFAGSLFSSSFPVTHRRPRNC
jgi:hypothetical protein